MSRRRQNFGGSLSTSSSSNQVVQSSQAPPQSGVTNPSIETPAHAPSNHLNPKSHNTDSGDTSRAQSGAGNGNGKPRGKPQRAIDGMNKLSISQPTQSSLSASSPGKEEEVATTDTDLPPEFPTSDEESCFICAERVRFWSVGVCGHRTCHVCAIRLRALYKKYDCTFCKTLNPSLLFSTSPTADFPIEQDPPPGLPPGSLDLSRYQYHDVKLGVVFESAEMMEETLLLLRFNCPNPTCSFQALSWDGLQQHTLAVHGGMICNICRRELSRFAHEQVLYPPHLLALHDPSQLKRGQRKPVPRGKAEEEMVLNWGEPHPMCDFCHEAFFGSEELQKHMKNRHEECFVCKNIGERDLFFLNYPMLEQHFHRSHFPCTEKECLEKKFVVFGSEIDWRAHMMAEHQSSMSSKDKYHARQVNLDFMGSLPPDFSFIPPEPVLRRAGGGGQNGNGAGPSRQRQLEPVHQFSSQRRTRESREPIQSQQLAHHLTGSNRRAGFRGTLTMDEQSENELSRPASGQGMARSGTATPREDVDERTAARHADLLGRVSAMVDFSETKMSSFRHSIRSFKNNESGAKDMVDTIYSVLERDADATLKIVREIASLMNDNEEKMQAIYSAVNAFKADRQNEFPSLGGPPTSIGTEYSGITSGKVLDAKRATQTSSSHLFDRVERAATSGPSSRPANATTGPNGRAVPGAASSSQAFPALGPGTSKKVPAGSPATGWANRAATTVAMPLVTLPPQPRSVNYHVASSSKKPAAVSNAAFPSLPTPSSGKGLTAAEKKALFAGNNARQETIRRIAGDNVTPPSITSWGGNADESGSSTPSGEPRTAKKKNKKELLFTVSGR